LTDLKGDDPDFIRTVIVNNQDIFTNFFIVAYGIANMFDWIKSTE